MKYFAKYAEFTSEDAMTMGGIGAVGGGMLYTNASRDVNKIEKKTNKKLKNIATGIEDQNYSLRKSKAGLKELRNAAKSDAELRQIMNSDNYKDIEFARKLSKKRLNKLTTKQLKLEQALSHARGKLTLPAVLTAGGLALLAKGAFD